MKEFWNFIQMVFMAVGGWLGWFMGGCDGLLYALVAFVVIDYLTGVMCAFADHTLSSEVGFRGICRKVLIFLLVGMANILDVAVVKNKVIDVIVMNLAGFVHKTVAGLVQPGFHKAFPLAIRKLHGVQDLQLRAHVGQQFFRRVEARSVLVALILQILNKLPLQVAFSLVAFNSLPVAYIRIENDEVVGFGYGLEVVHCNLVDIWPFEMCYPAAFFDLGKLNSMSR